MAEVGGLDLSRKIGPFPLGVWILASAGGLAIAYFMNRGLSSGVASAGGGGTVIESGVGGTPGGFVPAPQPDDETEDTGPLDNEAWAFKATTWLVTHNYSSIKAGVAIRKYLDGEKLSSEEATMIDAVVKELGPPPTIPVGGGIDPPVSQPSTGDEPTGLTYVLTQKTGPKRRAMISWKPYPGALFYQVQKQGAGTWTTLTNSWVTGGTGAWLKPGGTGFYRVRANLGTSFSGWSEWLLVKA